MKISIIVPVYNEEETLPLFIQELISYLNNTHLNYELLLVENGSRDDTLKIARSFAQENKKIKVFHLSKPSYGLALIYGFKKAVGDYVVVYNVDFWDSRFIDLVKVNLLGYDVISGSKNLPGSMDKRPFGRKLVTKGYNFFLKLLLGFNGTDTHGIKVLRIKSFLPVVKKCRTQTGIFDSELLIRAQRANLKILELPVNVEEIRPNRFGFKRILETPRDIWELIQVLK